MEHRCTERYTGDLTLLIYKHNVPIAVGRVKNGSRIGVFIETEFADIECEQQLTFEVILDKSNATKWQRIEMKALVIHKTNRGFGAEVDFSSAELADLFLEILRGRPMASHTEVAYAMVANS